MERGSTKLRKLLKGDEFFIKIVVGTAHEALLAEKLGFKALFISGAFTSVNILGVPDVGLITLTELAENVERICSAVALPAMVDCDTGFGNAINVRRTVASVIRAGGAGLFPPKDAVQITGDRIQAAQAHRERVVFQKAC